MSNADGNDILTTGKNFSAGGENLEFQHELIIPNEGLPFKIFLFEGGHGNYEREKHWHTSIEIFAVLKGRLTFFLNEVEYPLEAGELIIINSNEIHSIHAPEKNETVILQIPLKQFEKYFVTEKVLTRYREKFNGEALPPYFGLIR